MNTQYTSVPSREGWGGSSVGSASGPACCWCRFDSLVQQGIIFSESTFSADFLTVCAQPFYAIACINSCARVWKTLSTGRKTTAWTQENTAHTRSTLQVGMWLPKWSREWSYTQFISWEESVLPPFQRGMQKNIYTCVKKTWFKYQLRGPSSFGKGMIFSSISKKKKERKKKKKRHVMATFMTKLTRTFINHVWNIQKIIKA